MRVSGQTGNQAIDLVIQIGGFFSRPRYDQWRAGFVYQDTVDLVHDGKVELTLDQRFTVELHIVSQIIEAEFIIRPVGDVRSIGSLPFIVVQSVHDGPDGQSQELVDMSHPLGVAPCQIIVDGNDMHAFSRQCVQISRQGGGQGFTFTGFHFRDLALMKNDPPNQLNIKMPHVQRAHRCLPDGGKRFRKKVIKIFTLIEALSEFSGTGFELFIAEGLNFRLQGVDLIDERLNSL